MTDPRPVDPVVEPLQSDRTMDQIIEQFIVHLPYLGVVLVLTAGGFGMPIPEDLPLLIGGYLCGVGQAQVTIMLPVSLAAVVGADFMVYLLGRRYGHHVPKLPLLRRYLSEQRLVKAEISFHKHGGKTLFFARFMPGLRTPIYFSAGAFKLPAWKMLMFDGLAALVSVPAWVLLAWYLAKTVDIQTLRDWSFATQVTLIVMAVAAAVGVVGWKVIRSRRLASTG